VSDPDAKQRVIEFYNQEAASYIEQYQLPRREQEFYPANDIRLEILVRILKARGVRTVLDIGCGSAGPLLRFLREGWDAVGFDFSPEMVSAAREVLTGAGVEPARVRAGDVEQAATIPPGSFDAVVATGVFPHNLDDRAAYANVKRALAPGGVALIEYRNALMSLYSLNRYSEPFFWHELMRADELPAELRDATRVFLAKTFDTPVESVGRPRKIEYENILARFHNPLTIGAELASHGLRLRAVHYYHFHAAPPAFERSHTRQFREASLRLEQPDDWRGMFLASAFVAELEHAS